MSDGNGFQVGDKIQSLEDAERLIEHCMVQSKYFNDSNSSAKKTNFSKHKKFKLIFSASLKEKIWISKALVSRSPYQHKKLWQDLNLEPLPYLEEDILFLLNKFAFKYGKLVFHKDLNKQRTAFINILERYGKHKPLPEKVHQQCSEWLDQWAKKTQNENNDLFDDLYRMNKLVKGKPNAISFSRFVKKAPWSIEMEHDIAEEHEDNINNWYNLIRNLFCQSDKTPTAQWVNEISVLVNQIGKSEATDSIIKWLDSFRVHLTSHEGFSKTDELPTDPKKMKEIIDKYEEWEASDPNNLSETQIMFLKGLINTSQTLEQSTIVPSLTLVAMACYKTNHYGHLNCAKIGNFCVKVLGDHMGIAGVEQLAYLKTKIKNGTVLNQIEKAFQAAAERLRIPREELEELGMPTCGLSQVGYHEQELGEYHAVIEIDDSNKPLLIWKTESGKIQKTVPKPIKENHPDELKQLKANVKEIQKMLPVLTSLLDRLFLLEKTWDYHTWKTRFLDHPLMGVLARRTIWIFLIGENSVEGIFFDDQFVDINGNPLDNQDQISEVRIWHPLDTDIEKIKQWRNFLFEQEIRQPVKQAHREVYLLTDTERETEVYSNRFAAHILRQHQFTTLCKSKGWNCKSFMIYEGGYDIPFRSLEKWNMKAEFWVKPFGEEEDGPEEDAYNESGTYWLLRTDQVRFYPLDQKENDIPISLSEIPAKVFSEIMRDVDMFVSVGSVGNDPEWKDSRAEGPDVDYWNRFAFGSLDDAAEVRKEVLQKVIPSLKIAQSCRFDDDFLIVEGKLNSYQIHLGTGNVKISHTDSFLNIVPQTAMKKKSEAVFLPFEGDKTLSLVLSKALLLADDHKIKDPVIREQIEGQA